jgi:hypothetical protein
MSLESLLQPCSEPLIVALGDTATYNLLASNGKLYADKFSMFCFCLISVITPFRWQFVGLSMWISFSSSILLPLNSQNFYSKSRYKL